MNSDDLVRTAVEEAARDMGLGPDEKVHTPNEKLELARQSWRRWKELRPTGASP